MDILAQEDANKETLHWLEDYKFCHHHLTLLLRTGKSLKTVMQK
jgi:hypothetical protein